MTGLQGAVATSVLALASLGVGAATADDSFQVLHSFDYEDGMTPLSVLLEGSDGRFYGTTSSGGQFRLGTVFAVDAQKNHAVLHSFNGEDGYGPSTTLMWLADGGLLGSTPQGTKVVGPVVTGFGGTIYRIGSDGQFSVLRRLEYNDPVFSTSPSAFTPLGDGSSLGMLRGSLRQITGQLVRLLPNGELEVLHNLTSAEGAGLGASLSPSSSGVWRGSLGVGPSGAAHGALFEVNSQGQVRLLHVFNGADGRAPAPGLVEDSDGSLWGVTGGGGPADAGTLFRLNPQGVLETQFTFNGNDGAGPVGGLVRGPDRALYGVTFSGGYKNQGTVFRFDPLQRQLTTLRLLQTGDGIQPSAAPVLGSDGWLYGTTTRYGGAPGAGGSVFRFDVLAPHAPQLLMRKVCHNEFELCMTPYDVGLGGRYTIYWNSANHNRCTASGAWTGQQALAGQLDVVAKKMGRYTYKLKCSGPTGTATQSVTVRVGL